MEIANGIITNQILEYYVDVSVNIISNNEVVRYTIERGKADDSWNFLGKFDFKKMEIVKFLSMLWEEKDIVTTSFLNAKDLLPQSKAKYQTLDICTDQIISAIY